MSTVAVRRPRVDPGVGGAWLMVCCAAGLDILTTHAGLTAGLLEFNPLARRAFATVGFLEGALALKTLAVAVGVVGWRVLPARVASAVPLLLATIWTLAAAVNAVGVVLA